jgi:hypothetical protein
MEAASKPEPSGNLAGPGQEATGLVRWVAALTEEALAGMREAIAACAEARTANGMAGLSFPE